MATIVPQNRVFVLDATRHPLTMCHPARARRLLRRGHAAVFRRFPFTIILKVTPAHAVVPSYRLKLDPGARTTGMALVETMSGRVAFAAELCHRGPAIHASLAARRALRRNRRSRLCRHRPARFLNRRRPRGWLAPSLNHRVCTTLTWVRRFQRYAPVSTLSMELVRFDTQALQYPDIAGTAYQQGTLVGYEVREYLLAKWGRRCQYCDAERVPLQIDHIVSRIRGGTNRVSNLTLACQPCNQRKGQVDISQFLAHDPARRTRILTDAKTPLKDAAAVNSTRWALFRALTDTGLPLETGTGGRTKFNRAQLGLPKTHWIDAACVGHSGLQTKVHPAMKPFKIRACGHGTRQICGTDRYGFPIRHRQRQKVHYGFQTGDIVRARIPTGKYAGLHYGRVACRATGSFDLRTRDGRLSHISYRYCVPIHRKDGYAYH